MADEGLREGARRYVDAQLEIMRRYGSAPILSDAEYEGLIEDVVDAALKLRRVGKILDQDVPLPAEGRDA